MTEIHGKVFPPGNGRKKSTARFFRMEKRCFVHRLSLQ